MSAFPEDNAVLRDRVVVITGGASGLGQACTELFVASGAKVIVGSRRFQKEAIEPDQDALKYLPLDLADMESIDRFVQQARQVFGPPDALLLNAGEVVAKTLDQCEEADFDRMFDVHVKGHFFLTKHFLPDLCGHPQSSIVATSSYLGPFAGSGFTPAYGAAKSALIAFTRSLARQHGPEGLRANAICPAFIPTDLNKFLFEGPDGDVKRQQMIETYPLGRLGTPQDFAHLARFLISHQSRWLTGQAIVLDGGKTA